MNQLVNEWNYEADFEAIVESGQVAIDRLANSTIFITGGTGLIGTCLVDFFEYLSRVGGVDLRVILGVRNPERARELFSHHRDPGFLRLVEYDMDSPVPPEVGPFEYFIHLAGIADPKLYTSAPVETIESTINGARFAIAACEVRGARLLFTSTVEVYGDTSSEVVSEGDFGGIDPTRVRSSYPVAKCLAEALCTAHFHQRDLDVVIARPGKVFGPSNTPSDSRVMAHMLRKAKAQEDIELSSDGTSQFTFCYVSDAISGLVRILTNGKSGEAYNISNESASGSLREIATFVAQIAGVDARFGEGGGSAVSRDLPISSSRLRALGWTPLTSLEDGLRKQYYAGEH